MAFLDDSQLAAFGVAGRQPAPQGQGNGQNSPIPAERGQESKQNDGEPNPVSNVERVRQDHTSHEGDGDGYKRYVTK
ncbi:hypothetical protein ES707_08690 [subsurface metagenome]